MDQPETLIEAVEPKVEAPKLGRQFVFSSRFNAAQFLSIYDSGRRLLTAKNHERWRDTFAIGLSTGGLFYGSDELNNGLISIFWRTDSPNVNVRLRVPEYNPDGSYVYVCWLWNQLGLAGMRALRNHIRKTQVGARRLAHHDQRKDSKRRGELIDVPLYPRLSEDALAKLLAERNGHSG